MKKIIMADDEPTVDLYRVYLYRGDTAEEGKDLYYEDYDMALKKAEHSHRCGYSVIVYKNEVIHCEYEQ